MAEGDEIVVPRQQFMDRLSRVDELLELLVAKPAGELTVEIPALPDPLPVTFPLADPLPVTFPLTDPLPVALAPPADPFILAYPGDGTRATIAAGTTTINFKTGSVKAPDGTITTLSSSLDLASKNFMRSVVINTDAAIVIQMDSRDKIPARAGAWAQLQDTEFEKLYITATTDTEIFVSASTAAKSVITVSGGVSVAVKSTIADGRKVVTVAGTAEALASSTACKLITITAETDNTDIVVVGGSTVVAALATRRGIPLYPGDSYELGIDDLSDVYIDALVSGEGVTYTYFN